MPIALPYFFPLGTPAAILARELNTEIFKFRLHTFAESTKQSYRTHKGYLSQILHVYGY